MSAEADGGPELPRWEEPGPGSSGLPGDVVTLARDALSRDPDSPLLIFDDGISVTRERFRRGVEGFAGYLAERISPGDRVAIMLENRTEFMMAWLATNACGGSLVSINTSAGEHDAGHIIRDSGSVIAVVGEADEALVRAVPDTDLKEVVVVSGQEPDGLDPYAAQAAPLPLDDVVVDPEAITNVYYTSGTTGPPKGCTIGHDYWIRFADLYLRLYGMTPDDRIFCCLQFFYNDPPWQFLVSLHAGTALVATRRFSVSRFWKTVREHDITRVFALASIPSLLLKAEPSPLEREHDVDFAVHIGIPAGLHSEFVERWGFPWTEGYGLTETGLVVAMPLAYADEMTGSGSIGIPCPEVEIRLVGDDGEEVEAGEPGEILIKAPGMMRGYLNRPEATAETLRDGWIHSGDLAARDERGFIYFRGRKKDIIRRAGENVAAAEVEDVVRSHPDVLEAAVFPAPDELRGEEVMAIVGLVEGRQADSTPPRELIEFCRERLSKHKVPRYVSFRSEPFPRTPSMRVKKSELLPELEKVAQQAWDRDQEMPDWATRRTAVRGPEA